MQILIRKHTFYRLISRYLKLDYLKPPTKSIRLKVKNDIRILNLDIQEIEGGHCLRLQGL